METINILTFNILARSWAQNKWYAPSASKYLGNSGVAIRLPKIIKLIEKVCSDPQNPVTIIGLQETEDIEFKAIVKALNNKDGKGSWSGYQTFHDDSYWSNYDIPSTETEPKRLPNGVGLIIKNSVYKIISETSEEQASQEEVKDKKILMKDGSYLTFDFALGDKGNHCIFFPNILNKENGKILRVCVCHLDSDTGGGRDKESKSAVNLFTVLPITTSVGDILMGDLNANIDGGVLNNNLKSFTQSSVGKSYLNQTHPFTGSYASNDMYGKIDHIMFKNMSLNKSFQQGAINFGLWDIYPYVTKNGAVIEEARINANFEYCGSDHFPVIASLTFLNSSTRSTHYNPLTSSTHYNPLTSSTHYNPLTSPWVFSLTNKNDKYYYNVNRNDNISFKVNATKFITSETDKILLSAHSSFDNENKNKFIEIMIVIKGDDINNFIETFTVIDEVKIIVTFISFAIHKKYEINTCGDMINYIDEITDIEKIVKRCN